jgi:molecular chaperone DnaJ
MRRDPYLVLGVDRKASQDEIGKAFRSLASKYHPDRNPDNPQEASVKFKEVTAAYELLGDESKRKQYDFYSSGQFPGFGFRTRNSVDDVFDNLFSQFFGNGRPHPSAARTRVRVSLAEAFSGCTKVVKGESHESCGACSGTGSSEWRRCDGCNGSGFLFTSEGPMRIQTSCVHCSGRGSVSKQSCRSCNGRGQVVKSERQVEVAIPPGAEDGMQIRLAGEGPNGGDLFAAVVVDKHPAIERHQRNLVSAVEVPYSTLVLGGDTSFRLFDSEISVKIPPRTKAGSRLRIRGQGMPALQNPKLRGDLFLEISLKIPGEIGAEHEKLLKKLEKLDSSD